MRRFLLLFAAVFLSLAAVAEVTTLASWTFTSSSYPANKTAFAATDGTCLESTFYLDGTGSTWNTSKGYAFTAVTSIKLTLKTTVAIPSNTVVSFAADMFYNKATNAPATGYSLTVSENGSTATTTGLNVTSISLSKTKATQTVNYTTQTDLAVGATIELIYTQTGKVGSGQAFFGNIVISADITTGGGSETLSFDKSSVELTYGDEFAAPTLNHADGLTINWSSTKTDVATVDGTGNVEIKGIGTTKITATDASDNTNTASYELIVNAKPHGLAYETTSYVVNAGETFTTPTLTNPNGLTVTYASNNEEVATVDANTGDVTLTGNFGTTTITATAEEQNFFAAGAASYTITVSKQYIFADTYAVLVSDVKDLNVGDVIIIANQDASVAMSTENKDNNFGETAVTLSEDKSTISSIGDAVLLMELEKDGDYWLFKTLNRLGTNGYLTTNESTTSTKNYLKTTTNLTDNNYPLATIEITSGVAKIIFNQGSNDNRNWLRYNKTVNSGQLFSCYASGQADVYIYKLVTPEFKADITIAVDETEGDANKITFSGLQESHGLKFDLSGYSIYLNGTEIGGTDVDLAYLPFVPSGNFTISNGTNTYPVAVTWPISDFSTIEAKVTKAEYFAYCDEEHTVTGWEDSMWYLDAEYTIAPDCEVSNLYFEMTCTLFDPDNESGSTVEKKDNKTVCVNRVGMFMLGEDPTFETNVNGSFNVTLTFPFYVKTALKGMMLPAETEKVTSFEGVETLIDVTASAGQVPQPGDEGGNVSGVESVVVDSEGAVEYYNLQGVRVEGALTPGIYIRRTATGTSKVAIR